jgi:hypothetical protein
VLDALEGELRKDDQAFLLHSIGKRLLEGQPAVSSHEEDIATGLL